MARATSEAFISPRPTAAFPGPWELDARRCISYLTIETREPFPAEFAQRQDPWLYGCDICQEVCPWNRFDERRPAPPTPESRLASKPGHDAVSLDWLATSSEIEIATEFRATPLMRPGPEGLKRNGAAISPRGNQPPRT